MIERQVSAERLNELSNHPSIYPWICGPFDGPLDFTEAFNSGSIVALLGEHGGFVFHKIADGIFDGHSAVLPEGRGHWAISTVREAISWMFDHEGASEIMMAVPKGNLAVRALVRMLKAKFRGTIEDGWWRDGHAIPSDIFSITKSDW